MKNFPKRFDLNIFGNKVPVKVVKNLALDHGLMGLYSKSKNEILVGADQTKDEAIMTLVHEIFHALAHRTGLNQAISHELEEILAEQISIVMHENFNLSLKKKK